MSAAIIAILIAAFVSFVYLSLFKKSPEHVQKLSKLPTVPLLLGCVPTEFLTITPEGLLPLFSDWIQKYGSAMGGWILNRPYVLLFKADHVQKILGSAQQIDRSDDYDVLVPWGGQSIVTISGPEWHARKKLIQPAFHFKNFHSFVDIFNEQAAILVDQLTARAGEDAMWFDVVPYGKRCALDMICEAGLGVKVNSQTNHQSEFLDAAEKIGKLISERWLKPYLRINWLWKLLPNGWQQRKCLRVLHKFTRDAVEARIQARKASEFGRPRAAFLDMLLDLRDSGALTMQTLLDESNIFINAGHETTALSIAWSLFLIGTNSRVQHKVRKELTSVFGDDKSCPVTPHDLSKLAYLECCIKEVHRLCAPVPIMARKLNQDCPLDDGAVLPSGTVTVMSIYHIQRDPDYFQNPTEFRPERFEDKEEVSRMHPYAFIPFSAGSRNCIGKKVGELEVKIVLTHILRNLWVEAMIPFKETRPYPAAVLFPGAGLPVRVCRR